MREIKFRAYAHASKKMFYPDEAYGWEIREGTLRELPNTTLMQFTGLHDKNGKDIYEGDIVRVQTTHAEYTGEIVFGSLGYDLLWSLGDGTKDGVPMMGMEYFEFDLLGNIHENPELLEAK